ncbi:MAG: hypothetical protein EXQ67_04860 [Thermoleophilia bacterium]|nr:hypothetical protein [Thermoleophilia bacterium]
MTDLQGRLQGMCLESPIAAGNANPYLAFAATIAAGLDGIDRVAPLVRTLEVATFWARAQNVATRRTMVISGLLDLRLAFRVFCRR